MPDRLASALSPLWALTNTLARPLLSAQAKRLPCPVISVGNVLAGGVGKTELACAIAARLTSRGKRVTIASRGYGSRWEIEGGVATDASEAVRRGFPDESIVVLRKARGVSVAVGRDRHGVLTRNWDALKPDVVLLDDGFQHFKLARDLDIVVHDFSVRHPIWRDRLSALSHVPVRVSLSDVPAEWRSRMLWVEGRYRLKAAVDARGARSPLPNEALAFCGLGNPERFKAALESAGTRVREFRAFADHHDYTEADAHALAAWIGKGTRVPLLTSLKDFVKLETLVGSRGGVAGFEPLWVELGLELTANESLLWKAIDAVTER